MSERNLDIASQTVNTLVLAIRRFESGSINIWFLIITSSPLLACLQMACILPEIMAAIAFYYFTTNLLLKVFKNHDSVNRLTRTLNTVLVVGAITKIRRGKILWKNRIGHKWTNEQANTQYTILPNKIERQRENERKGLARSLARSPSSVAASAITQCARQTATAQLYVVVKHSY